MKKTFILLISAIGFFCSLSAQNTDYQTIVNNAFGPKTEIYFTFEQPTNDVLLQLGKMISIDNVKNNQVIAVANKNEFALFLEYNIEYSILPSPWEMLSPEDLRMTENMNNRATYAWDAYPTYQAYVDMMVAFANDYPTLCKLDTIGYTVQGRILLAAVISDNINVNENEPRFLYTSTMHGDEVTPYVLMLRLIDYLLVNYGTDSKVSNLVNNIEIYINPNANPDGTYKGGNSSVSRATRSNANNVDLNRNYPVPNGSQYPNGTRQIETQQFMDWAQEKNFVMSANFHGGAELMNYPWDYTTTNHPDKLWWSFVCTEYATSAQNNSPSGYFVDNLSGFDGPGVTEGASWYSIDGSRQDYMQYYAYCREVTNEISEPKMPPASELPNYWNYNYRALMQYMKQVLYGYRGIVTDGCTGNPMVAKIEIVGHDAQNSHVYSSLPIGNYHRPIKAGTYTIRASAPGYVSQEYANVTIADSTTIVRNFTLTPVAPTVQFTAFNVYTCDGIVEFINSSTAGQDAIYTWNFGDGTTSNDENPVHTYTGSGIYTVKLAVMSCSGEDSLTRTSYIEVEITAPPVTADQSRCGQGTLSFTATGNGTIYWFSDAAGTNLLDTGTTYTTPVLNSTTSYWLNSSIREVIYGGLTNKTATGAYFTLQTKHGLYFNCSEEAILKSVKVYCDAPGLKTISLLDASDNVIQSGSFSIPNGESRVELNFTIPPQSGLRLMGPASPGLWRDGSTSAPNLPYPFAVGSTISITGNSANNPKYYYYFYDWEVETLIGCESQTVPVTGYIYSTPISDFSWIENSFVVTFTNASTGGGTYLWDFGDGETSTDENPVHTYATGNGYTITLTITNDCGTDFYTEQIAVSTVSVYDTDVHIEVFPNPANDIVLVKCSETILKTEIFNLQGQRVLSKITHGNSASINVESLTSGIYFLKITTEHGTIPHMIMKQ